MLVYFFTNLGRIVINKAASRLEKARMKHRRSNASSSSEDEKSAVVIGKLIASVRHPGEDIPVKLSFKTRLRHCFITGQSGSGKTTLARTLLVDDLSRGNGLVNIDYRGESTDLLLQLLAERFTPEQLRERLILLDLRQRSAFGEPNEPVVAFNPLLEIGDDGYAATAFFLDVLRQVWGESTLGVQLIDDLRHVLLALTLSPRGPFTILDIERVLTDAAFRSSILQDLTDPVVLRFFERFEKVKDPEGRVLPIMNKLSPLIATHRRLRATLGGTKQPYSFRAHFEKVENPIVLICLAADETAKSVAGVVGALFLSAAIKAIMRSDRPVGEEPTRGVHFLLDEAANYATAIEEPLGELIREGRKFGAFCTLITQTPSSLSPSIRNLLIDVVGTMCFFAQGPQQAENLAGWVNSEEMPKAVVRVLLMQFPPGDALLLRQGNPPRRMRASNTPHPKVAAAKVSALRKAALSHWGTSEPSPQQLPTQPEAVVETSEAVEVREIEQAPKRSRRRKAQ